MLWTILAGAAIGALLGAAATRWTGAGHLGPGRVLCALLIAVPIALDDWVLALGVAALSHRGKSLAHGKGLSGQAPLFMADTGLLFTGFAAIAELALGHWIFAALFTAAGAAKGLTYLLPEGTRTTGLFAGRFVWKELATGAVIYAVAGAATADALIRAGFLKCC